MGTARMGTDPSTSVVSPSQHLWDVDNVFVCDSSVFVTSAGYNPTLTLAALAHRAATLTGWSRFDRSVTDTMRAAVLGGGPGKLAVEDVPVPDVGDGDVLVAVELCGVCGSDLHMVLDGWGRKGSWEGHEWVGTHRGRRPRGDEVEGRRRGRRRSLDPLRRMRHVPRRSTVAVRGARHAGRHARSRRVRHLQVDARGRSAADARRA